MNGEISVRYLHRLALCFLFLAPAVAAAQTISPVVIEYREKGAGRFQIHNDTDFPLTVVLEPHSFTVDSAGSPDFVPLSPDIHLDLATTSFRIGPKQDYFVFYKATADKLPNWFCIYANITGPHTQEGIQVKIALPHTVYLLGKKPGQLSDIVWVQANATSGSPKPKIEAAVENHGTDVTRVREVEVTSASGKQIYEGFPLFPGQRRLLNLDWGQKGTPQHIQLKFERFKAETNLGVAPH
jgi:P pilus assembly chaperone PapD